MSVKLLLFAGSARKDSLNKRLVKAASLKAAEFGADVTVVDLKDFPMPVYCGDIEENDGVPEAAKELADIVKQHNGIFIACPEYNSSITPLLKNTLDWVSRLKTDASPPRTPWHGRVYAIGGTSMGMMGGLRGIQYMTQLLINGYQLQVIPQTVAVGRGHEIIEDDGSINNPQVEAMLIGSMKALIETAQKLKP